MSANTFASSNWQEYASNPILSPSFSGNWNSLHVVNPSLIKVNNLYKIYYQGHNGTNWTIGKGESLDGITSWTSTQQPIIPIGSLDGWETDTTDPTITQDNTGLFHLYYTSFNSSHWASGLDRTRIRHAVSSDGSSWTRDDGWQLYGAPGKWDEGGPSRGKSIVMKDGIYYMFYAGTDSGLDWKIGLATSSDGINWFKQNNGNPVIIPTQSWELQNVSYPTVLYENGIFKMWYSAGLWDQPTQIVYAESSDGINWNKPANQNPVLTTSSSGFDSIYVNANVILHENGFYKLWYSGFNSSYWSIGYATKSDTNDLSVPLLKQTDPLWGSQTYDSADIWAPAHATIADWGCAMTSAAMVLQYYGINKLPDSTDLNPGTLNTWLKNEPDGYIDGGYINWLAIAKLTKQAKANNPSFAYDALEYTQSTQAAVLTDDLTNNNQPDILEEPGHFIVAKGVSGNTFDINDPYYDNRLTLNSYSNSFLKIGRFVPSHTNLSYILLTADQNVDILIANSSGQKTGSDGVINYNNIPNATYFTQQGINDPLSPGASSAPIKELLFPKPQDGEYIITVSATGSAMQNYSLNAYAYTATGSALMSSYAGGVKNNQPDNFAMQYQQDPSTEFIVNYCVKGAKLTRDQRSFCHLLRRLSR